MITEKEAKSIIDNSPIEVIIGRFVHLKKTGVNYTGCCPFHNEKTPSFSVHPGKGIYKCFGCGAGGDVVEFIKQKENLNYPSALKYLADINNMVIEMAPQKQEPVKSPYDFKSVDRNILIRSLAKYDQNILFNWFESFFDTQTALNVFQNYYAGTTKSGGTIFWQVDRHLNVRNANIIQYSGFNRDKSVHPKRAYLSADGYSSCFFGLHLLFDDMARSANIMIVESEKTAMIASVLMPELGGKKCIWLASSGSNGMTKEKIEQLKGYNVILVPDHKDSAIEAYRKKLEVFEKADISCKLFSFYPELNDGSDIADELIKIDLSDFSKQDDKTVTKSEIVKPDASKYVIRKEEPLTDRQKSAKMKEVYEKDNRLQALSAMFDLSISHINDMDVSHLK